MPKYLGDHVILATPLFENFSRGRVRTVPTDKLVKFGVHIFNRFRAIAIFGTCAQTDRQTDKSEN